MLETTFDENSKSMFPIAHGQMEMNAIVHVDDDDDDDDDDDTQ